MSKIMPGYVTGSWQKTVDWLRVIFGLVETPEKIPLYHCANCGGNAKMKHKDFRSLGLRFYVQCQVCGIMTQAYKTEEAAAKTWNHRYFYVGVDFASGQDQTVIEEAKVNG